ncbi:hypothetical protein [Mucilaginibacter paludis]|uniref:T9SS C-terminal target domain-containing protein n=1 Tax=Mucilaginibacter paludis DSM 18603 TaxID=714943 RepID=H1Y291_9SPHI|nr:hypothetical protein [Mucilaginibacter paludis]EHQ27871.1 hypothetical protein Mucpa_3773 [Mucilaginibacter paludis DSM 18603]
MKKHSLIVMFIAALFFSACTKNSNDETPVVNNANVVEVTGDISASVTWTSDKIYLLKGFVYVTNGATLTINAGTIVKGDKPTKGTLVVTRGAKIMAVGTATNPIVFTSNVAAGGRSAGDWGGVILLGKAPVNPTATPNIEGGLVPTNGGDVAKYIQYGGTDAADNSGTLSYVRIEYAGIPFSPDNEINGLTMGGVGSGTTLDYIEVYRSGDDAFEWFGGTVNAKHLLAIGTTDDDFDTDFGYSGKVQFGLAQRAQVVADFSGSNGFESDNDGSGSNNLPQTKAVFSNMTIVGPILAVTASGGSLSNLNANFQHAAQIRRNSSISIANSLFTNYFEGIYIDEGTVVTAGATTTNYTSGSIVFTDNIIYNCNAKGNEVKGQNKAAFETAMRATNTFDATKSVVDLLADPLKYGTDFKASTNANYGTPNFTLKSGAVALTGAVFTNAKYTDSFFEKVAYRGAFGTTDWSTGWASYDPQNIPYTTPGVVK